MKWTHRESPIGWLQPGRNRTLTPHHAYVFANRRANRLKAIVHDGIGIWLVCRRLHQGRFVWPRQDGQTLLLTRPQLDALVLGLPWHRVGEAGVIKLL